MARAYVHDIIAEDEVLKADIEPFVFEDDPSRTPHRQIKNIKDIAEHVSVIGHALSPDFHLILSKTERP